MSMTTEQQRNVFRMAAIVYGRSSKGVSLSKSYQKVVDDALFCCGRTKISLTDLIVYIKTNYGFLYTSKEIEGLITGRDASKKYHSYYEQNELMISLTAEYKNKLTFVCQEKTLYDYIDDYFAQDSVSEGDERDLILRFLYDMFTSNVEGYKLILQEQYDAATAATNYSEEEKSIINGFLNWPDNSKNKAIFDLAGYSLEYCMMTNKKNTSLNTQNLKNKSFYIDTNILYRAIGLNGDNLKTRAELFLSKFKEVGEKLVISQSTYVEFVDSIDYYIDKIDDSMRPRINSNVLQEFIDEDSVFLYYCKWRVGRTRCETKYFRDWIMSEFDSVCTRYEITREIKYPYNQEQCEKEIEDLASSIYAHNPEKPKTSAQYDAENVLWVEEKRKGNGDDIYQAKAFLLSSDNSLRRWDYQRNTNRVPIVMSPSQWLGIILHYMERTSDDYQSFISFLTLTTRREVLPIEKLSLIITGISQTTSDIETQQSLVRNFIERKTFDEVESMSDDELEQSAEEFAKTALDSRIESLERMNKNSHQKLADARKNLHKKDRELNKAKKQSEEELAGIKESLEASNEGKNKLEKENSFLRAQIQKQKLNTWRGWKIAYGVVVALLAVVLCLMVYLWRDAEWNFMYKFVQCVDADKESVAHSLAQAIIVIPLSIIAYGGWMVVDACNVDEYDKKKCRFLWASKD